MGEAQVTVAQSAAHPLPLAPLAGPVGAGGAKARLSGFERRWTQGVLEAMYPTGEVEGMPGASEVQLLEFYEYYLPRAPFLTRLGLRAIFFLVAWTPLFFIGIPLPVHRLSPAQRHRHLDKWAHSNPYWIREGITLIKAVTLMGYAGHPRVQQALGMRSS